MPFGKFGLGPSRPYLIFAAVLVIGLLSLLSNWFDLTATTTYWLSTGISPVQAGTNTLPSSSDTYLAACLVIKDQNQDFLEWMLYHNMLGVERFYVFDHMSQPPLQQAPHVGSFIESGLIEYVYFKYRQEDIKPSINSSKPQNPQQHVYKECIDRYRHQHQWMMFLDVDEFLVLDSNKTLHLFLKPYEPYGGLVVNWRIFGSSNHKRRPAGGALENYLSCFPARELRQQRHVKTIANCDYINDTTGQPHSFEYSDNKYAVDEFYQRVDGPYRANSTTGSIILHHYVFKSVEDYKNKMARGSGAGNHKDEKFYKQSSQATETCSAGLQLADRLLKFATSTYGIKNVTASGS